MKSSRWLSVPVLCGFGLATSLVDAQVSSQVRTTGAGVKTSLVFSGPSSCEQTHLFIKSRKDSGDWNGSPVDTAATTIKAAVWDLCTGRFSDTEVSTTVQELQVSPSLGDAALRASVDIPRADGSGFLDVTVDLIFTATDPIVRQRSGYVDHFENSRYRVWRTEVFRNATVTGTLTVDGIGFPVIPDVYEGSGASIEGWSYRVLGILH